MSTFADANDRSVEAVPATPARSTAVGHGIVASGSGIDTDQAAQSVSPNPNYRPAGFSQQQPFATPTTYHEARAFNSPSQGYQPSAFASPEGYSQSQYVSPTQVYQPSQYMSPNYALSPGHQHRNQYVQGSYQPATPQVTEAHSPYHGDGGGAYYSPTTFWPTPYLQDQNNGYQYYAGYDQLQRTPMAPMRSVSTYHAGQTPTRNVELAAQQHNLDNGEQTDEDTGESNGEQK